MHDGLMTLVFISSRSVHLMMEMPGEALETLESRPPSYHVPSIKIQDFLVMN